MLKKSVLPLKESPTGLSFVARNDKVISSRIFPVDSVGSIRVPSISNNSAPVALCEFIADLLRRVASSEVVRKLLVPIQP
jgi:hypothetical protein